MRAQKPPSLTRVSPVAGSRNSGIQGSVWSPSNVERASNSPPGAAAGGTLGAVAGAVVAGTLAGAAFGTQAGTTLTSAQPAQVNVITLADENAVRSGRAARFDERD